MPQQFASDNNAGICPAAFAALAEANAAGHALGWKLGLVAAMIIVSAVHDFVLGPRAGQAAPSSGEAMALRGRAAWVARINALLGVALVAAAVRLARGG